MTRDEAIKVMQLNKGRMNGSVRAALGVLLPELAEQAPQETVLKWRTCKAGDELGLRALIRYPAYAEIGYYAKADGQWVPMDEIENRQEKICATCAHYSARNHWDGYCEKQGEAGEVRLVVPADHVCALWEYYGPSGVEKKEQKKPRCFYCRWKSKCDFCGKPVQEGEEDKCPNFKKL